MDNYKQNIAHELIAMIAVTGAIFLISIGGMWAVAHVLLWLVKG